MLITKAVMSIHQCQYEDDQCTHDDGHCKYVGMPSDMWRQVMVYVMKTNPLHVDCHDPCDDIPLYVSWAPLLMWWYPSLTSLISIVLMMIPMIVYDDHHSSCDDSLFCVMTSISMWWWPIWCAYSSQGVLSWLLPLSSTGQNINDCQDI